MATPARDSSSSPSLRTVVLNACRAEFVSWNTSMPSNANFTNIAKFLFQLGNGIFFGEKSDFIMFCATDPVMNGSSQ